MLTISRDNLLPKMLELKKNFQYQHLEIFLLKGELGELVLL